MDKYFISSELAFYSPNHRGFEQSAGRSLVGVDSESLMYGFWFPAEQQTGKAIVLFSFDAAPLETRSLAKHFRQLDPIKSETVVRGKDSLGQFYYRVGYDYRPEGDPAIPATEE
jgi:dolichol-phosphate mannosyltransferase